MSDNIPKTCTNCDRKYTTKEKTNYKFQLKAKVIILLAPTLPSVFMAIYFLFGLEDKFTNETKIRLFLLSGIPSVFAFVYAYNLPRVLKLRCAKCKETQSFIKDVKNKYKYIDKLK